MSVGLAPSSFSFRSNSDLKCVLAMDSAVWRGSGGSISSISSSADLPARAEALNCAEEDLRDCDCLEGVIPPTPCREFIEAFLSSVGEEARASTLIEEELRRRGLRGGACRFGEELELCPRRDGDTTCGEGGRAVNEAVEIVNCCSESDRLFADGGSGISGGIASVEPSLDVDDAIVMQNLRERDLSWIVKFSQSDLCLHR